MSRRQHSASLLPSFVYPTPALLKQASAPRNTGRFKIVLCCRRPTAATCVLQVELTKGMLCNCAGCVQGMLLCLSEVRDARLPTTLQLAGELSGCVLSMSQQWRGWCNVHASL